MWRTYPGCAEGAQRPPSDRQGSELGPVGSWASASQVCDLQKEPSNGGRSPAWSRSVHGEPASVCSRRCGEPVWPVFAGAERSLSCRSPTSDGLEQGQVNRGRDLACAHIVYLCLHIRRPPTKLCWPARKEGLSLSERLMAAEQGRRPAPCEWQPTCPASSPLPPDSRAGAGRFPGRRSLSLWMDP